MFDDQRDEKQSKASKASKRSKATSGSAASSKNAALIKGQENQEVTVHQRVIRAWYGVPGHEWTSTYGKDVTAEVKELIKSHGHTFKVSSELLGNPAPTNAKPKLLLIETEALKNDFDSMFPEPLPERSAAFCALVSALALLNMLVQGLEADFGTLRHTPQISKVLFLVFNAIISLLFQAEMAFRVKAYGAAEYFRGGSREPSIVMGFLHTFDLLIVGVHFFDTCILTPFGFSHLHLRLVSLLRVVHIMRFVKVMRLHPYMRDCWLLCKGLADSIIPLAAFTVLLAVVLFTAATALTNLIKREPKDLIDYVRPQETNYDPGPYGAGWSLEDYWGNVGSSCFTLFQILTGDRWLQSAVGPLAKFSMFYLIFIGAVVGTSSLVLLNLVVAVVVENTIGNAIANNDKAYKETCRKDALVLESLLDIFEEADLDGSGELDRDEMYRTIKKEGVRHRLSMLGMSVADLDLLFDLLDEDGSQTVPTEQFFRGCARLRGPAMASDLHRLSISLNRLIGRTDEILESLDENNGLVEETMAEIEEANIDIVRSDKDGNDPVLTIRRQIFHHQNHTVEETRPAPTEEQKLAAARRRGSTMSTMPGEWRTARRASIESMMEHHRDHAHRTASKKHTSLVHANLHAVAVSLEHHGITEEEIEELERVGPPETPPGSPRARHERRKTTSKERHETMRRKVSKQSASQSRSGSKQSSKGSRGGSKHGFDAGMELMQMPSIARPGYK